MPIPLTTTFIPCNIQADMNKKWIDVEEKWGDFVDGGNGFLYGIPCDAPRVVEFNPMDKTIREIGPDVSVNGIRYKSGIRADNGSIYCIPYRINRKYRAEKHNWSGSPGNVDFIHSVPGTRILKITPMEKGNAEIKVITDENFTCSNSARWCAGALAKDGCIYYFPSLNHSCNGVRTLYDPRRILKLDTNNGDSLSLVGDDLRLHCQKYDNKGAVLGDDGCIYGINNEQILKFNPEDESILCRDGNFLGLYGDLLAVDGNIYALNVYQEVVKIDFANNDCTIIGSKVPIKGGREWGSPVLGADKCIYFPPYNHDRCLKFNPITQNLSMVGDSCGTEYCKFIGAALAPDGHIYCIPYNAQQILQIDTRHVNEQMMDFIYTHV